MDNIVIDVSNSESKYEEFKIFVSKHPGFSECVNNNIVTWQQLYDLYDKYGEDDNVFKRYYRLPTSSINNENSNSSYHRETKIKRGSANTNETSSTSNTIPTSGITEATTKAASNTSLKTDTTKNISSNSSEATSNISSTNEIFVDPDALNEFASNITSFASELASVIKEFKNSAGNLSGVWKGNSYDSFVRNYDSVITSTSNMESKIGEIGNSIRTVGNSYLNADQTH